jgi:hypothetical protein
MIGQHAQNILADAYLWGVRNFNVQEAFQVAVTAATTQGESFFCFARFIDNYFFFPVTRSSFVCFCILFCLFVRRKRDVVVTTRTNTINWDMFLPKAAAKALVSLLLM